VLRGVTVLAPVEQWSLGYDLRTGGSPVSASSLHDEIRSARGGRRQQTGSCPGGQCGDGRAIMKAPYRVVVPGDTPPHSRAGRGGNRRNAVLGLVALPATVIAAITAVTAAAVTFVTTSSSTTAASPPQPRGRISSSCAQSDSGSSKCVR